MSFSGLILTNSGRNELAKAEMGEKFCITDIVFGDGQYNGTRTDIKELVNPIMSLPVTKIERDAQNEGSVRVECDFNSADISKAFFWREIGIIANGKLCYYDNSREDAEYIDPESETIIKQKRMRFVLLISSDVEVNVTVGSALYALDEDMQRVLFPEYEGIAKLEELKSGEGIFKAFGKISKAISDLISHIGNKNNPHGVTKTQVGLGNVPNVASNDQTVTYTAATTLTALTSGEKLSVAFGKISKAISTLISHISIRATTSVLGHVKVTDSSAVTDSTGLALAATEKNAAIPGTLAYKIAEQNTNLAMKQDASTAITTSNIGSQSVNYASSSGVANTAVYGVDDNTGHDTDFFMSRSNTAGYRKNNSSFFDRNGLYCTDINTEYASDWGVILTLRAPGLDWMFQIWFKTNGDIFMRRSINTGTHNFTAWKQISVIS